MDAPADLMACGHPKGCIVSTEMDSACGWCQAVEQADKELYRKMVLACPEQNTLEHSGEHRDPWERLTSFVFASRQERHDLKAKLAEAEELAEQYRTMYHDELDWRLALMRKSEAQVERLKEVGRALREQVDNAPPGFTPNEVDEVLGE